MLIDKPYKIFLEIVETYPVINEKPDIEDVKKFRSATCNGMMDSNMILQRFNTLKDALSTYKEMGGIVYKELKNKVTKEEKELLKIDLLGRIPYNVKCEYKDELYEVIGYAHGRVVLVKPFMSSTISPLIEEVKPYLLPISSIAKRKNVEEFISVSGYETELGDYSGFDSETFYVDKVGREEYEYESENYIEFYPNFKSIDWLNKNNYDYRGLIEKGLAIDASYLNIY